MIGGAVEPAVSLSEAQAFVRIETGEEEAVLAGLVRSASALCEAFLGQVVVARECVEQLRPGSAWERLSASPVRAIASVETIDDAGVSTLLPSSAYAVDIDSGGDGWVRIIDPGSTLRIRVRSTAGMANGPNEVPEPIRQGVLRLAAHMFAARDGEDGAPPAAVTALWRPYRRMRLK